MATNPSEPWVGSFAWSRKAIWLYLKQYFFVDRNVSIGRNFHVGLMTCISSPDRLVIGNDVYVGKLCTIYGTGTIGNGTLIANRVGVGVGPNPAFRGSQIDIGSDVWIGFGSTILSGVRIGRGAIVAAGSVVMGNVDAYDVVAGNPAKYVGRRFTDGQIVAHEAAI